MNDPLIARFAAACGAAGPLDLRVGLADGTVLTEGSIDQPFTLLGRDDACDVTLSDPEVNPRHAWFQVIGGRVFALDLGSRTGLIWPDGQSRSAWLDGGIPVRIGPFKIHRLGAANRPTEPGQSAHPLQTDPNLLRSRPPVHLEFRNGKRAKDRWAINRTITLIGRSETCKLCLHADDIASFHCGLVLTPNGLWVVDLSGRGVVVNGERMRVAPLPDGAELWVGRFLISCHYSAKDEAASLRSGVLGPTLTGAKSDPNRVSVGSLSGTALTGPPTQSVSVLPLIAEDEVPLGRMPAADPYSGLPSSHIMFDAVRLPGVSGPASGPASSPILVTGAVGPTTPPMTLRLPPADTPTQRLPSGTAAPPLADKSEDSAFVPLLHQLSDIQSQMFDQFQQSLELMIQVCGQTSRGCAAAAQQELRRIQELNGELEKLQAEITRLAITQAAPPAPTHSPVSDRTPLPGSGPRATRSRPAGASEAIQDWVQERIGTLRKEQTAHWEKLAGMLDPNGR